MMKKETYEKIFRAAGFGKDMEGIWSVIGGLISLCAGICYASVIFSRVLFSQWKELEILILVPALSFVAVSIFRRQYNARRPYEVYGFKPLIRKETKGKSFPSRHVFSIFVIAVTIWHFSPQACIVLCFAGVILGGIRVITGVHFPRDVIAGAGVGIFFGMAANILFHCLS